MGTLKTRVCIVGSGIAGALCAKYLSQKVDDILIVERGTRMAHAERVKTEQQEIPIPTALHHHVVLGEVPKKRILYLYTLGGTTNHWMGQTPRLLPADFRMKSTYGVMEDWPISYDELEPYYCLAEEELSIAGGSDNPRAPRSKPYPLIPHAFSPMDRLFRECFPEGSIVSAPQARPTSSVGDRPACCASAKCSLCPIDSKYTTLNTHIPQLETIASIRFLPEKVVSFLETDGRRKVKRAMVLGNDGEPTWVEADYFVLAANALENPAILLRSPNMKQHRLTGRYLFDHVHFFVTFLLNRDGFPGYGQSIYTAHCYQFYEGDFRRSSSAALGEVFNPGILKVKHFVRQALQEGWTGSRLREEVRARYRRQITMNFLLEDRPDPARFIRIGKKAGKLGIPQTEIFYTKHSNYVVNARRRILKELPRYVSSAGLTKMLPGKLDDNTGHLLGTCRMGSSESGVVDADLRYHAMDNLYLLGGSAFPTYSPSNPTLTIAALAIRLGSQLGARI